jgi:hypothetical protein
MKGRDVRLFSTGDVANLRFTVGDLDPVRHGGYKVFACGKRCLKYKEAKKQDDLVIPWSEMKPEEPSINAIIEGRVDIYDKREALERLTQASKLMWGVPLLDMIGGLNFYDALVLDKPVWTERGLSGGCRRYGNLFKESPKNPKKINGMLAVPYDVWIVDWLVDGPPGPNGVSACGPPEKASLVRKIYEYAELWLVPELGYLPVRLDTFDIDMECYRTGCPPKRMLFKRHEVLRYEKTKAGDWFPVLGKVITPTKSGKKKDALSVEAGEVEDEWLISVETVK